MASSSSTVAAVGVLDYIDLDSALMWDPACPVLLPLGAITISPIMSASMGILVPFVLFVIAQFVFLYRMWDANARDDDNPSSSSAGGDAEAGGGKRAIRRSRSDRRSSSLGGGGSGSHAGSMRQSHRGPSSLGYDAPREGPGRAGIPIASADYGQGYTDF
jgi:hypothetical protein